MINLFKFNIPSVQYSLCNPFIQTHGVYTVIMGIAISRQAFKHFPHLPEGFSAMADRILLFR